MTMRISTWSSKGVWDSVAVITVVHLEKNKKTGHQSLGLMAGFETCLLCYLVNARRQPIA